MNCKYCKKPLPEQRHGKRVYCVDKCYTDCLSVINMLRNGTYPLNKRNWTKIKQDFYDANKKEYWKKRSLEKRGMLKCSGCKKFQKHTRVTQTNVMHRCNICFKIRENRNKPITTHLMHESGLMTLCGMSPYKPYELNTSKDMNKVDCGRCVYINNKILVNNK